jgi:hypothetical protein
MKVYYTLKVDRFNHRSIINPWTIAPIDHRSLFNDGHASTNRLVTELKAIIYIPKNQTPIHLYSKIFIS